MTSWWKVPHPDPSLSGSFTEVRPPSVRMLLAVAHVREQERGPDGRYGSGGGGSSSAKASSSGGGTSRFVELKGGGGAELKYGEGKKIGGGAVSAYVRGNTNASGQAVIVKGEVDNRGTFNPKDAIDPKATGQWATSQHDRGEAIATREVLASDVGRAIGAPVPEVERSTHFGDHEITMPMISGRTGSTRSVGGDTKLPGARELGAFDQIVGNADRHVGNYIVTGKGDEKSVVGIDHGSTFTDSKWFGTSSSPFTNAYVTKDGPGNIVSNTFGKDYLASLGPKLEGLRGQFEAAGKQSSYDAMMSRYQHLVDTAK